MSESTKQAGAADRGHAVGVVSKFREQVQHALGHWPAQRQVAGDFRTGVIANEQCVGAGRVGWYGSELVVPDPELSSAAQFPCYEAHRLRIFTRLGAELEINSPNLGVGSGLKPPVEPF